MNRLKDKYLKEVRPVLMQEFTIKNVMAAPKLVKIVINVGLGEAKDDQSILDQVVKSISALAGQQAVVTKAKQSISGFKLGKGQSVGTMVTLRGERMYGFLDKLITITLPKVRDFRGLPTNSFDGRGNYSLGLREQNIFPEISYQDSLRGSKIRGLQISVVSTSNSRDQGKRLLELFGMPFVKGVN